MCHNLTLKFVGNIQQFPVSGFTVGRVIVAPFLTIPLRYPLKLYVALRSQFFVNNLQTSSSKISLTLTSMASNKEGFSVASNLHS